MTPRDQRAQQRDLSEKLERLGKSLKELREKADLSKRALAKKLDVSPNFIWRIEKGETKRWPSEEQLNSLADALGDYSDEFRQQTGVVPRESKELLSKSQGLASTLELIHERFVDMLKAKGLSQGQIDYVLENATEQTILDVVNGKEPLDIGIGPNTDALVVKHEWAGHQVLGLPDDEMFDEASGAFSVRESASSYLESAKEAFLPESMASTRSKRRKVRSEESIRAGDARIVVSRPINREERSSLEAIAKVIAELLAK